MKVVDEGRRRFTLELDEPGAPPSHVAYVRPCVRITRLINFVADGNDSEGVGLTIKDLEVQARNERATIMAIVDNATAPVRLPTPDELVEARP